MGQETRYECRVARYSHDTRRLALIYGPIHRGRRDPGSTLEFRNLFHNHLDGLPCPPVEHTDRVIERQGDVVQPSTYVLDVGRLAFIESSFHLFHAITIGLAFARG